jgi:hypothetical protein
MHEQYGKSVHAFLFLSRLRFKIMRPRMKKLFILALCTFSFSCFAAAPIDVQSLIHPAALAECPKAQETNAPGFCPSFKSVAQCQCEHRSPQRSICTDMNKVYKAMIDFAGTVERACAFQKDTPTQTCLDDWACYRNGGKDSLGRLCSSTGSRCG